MEVQYTVSGYVESENEYDHLLLNSSSDTIYFTEDAGISERSMTASFLNISDGGDNLCIRCERKVYSAERVELDIILHKNCFKCGACGATLSPHTYVASSGPNGWRDVFCRGHAPKAQSLTLPPESMGIKNAVEAQRISKRESFNSQIRCKQSALGWEYDPKAKVFEHMKSIQEMNKFQRPSSYDIQADDIDYESGAVIRQLREGNLKRDKVKELAVTMAQSKQESRLLSRRRLPNYENIEPHCKEDSSSTPSTSSVADTDSNGDSEDTPYGYQSEIQTSNEATQEKDRLLKQHSETFYERLQLKSVEGQRGVDPSEGQEPTQFCQKEAVDQAVSKRKIEKANVSKLKENFQNEPQQLQIQRQLELKQREEQHLVWREIENSRQHSNSRDRRGNSMDKRSAAKRQQGRKGHEMSNGHVKDIDSDRGRNREADMTNYGKDYDRERARFQQMIDRQNQDMLMLTTNKTMQDLPAPGPPKSKKEEIWTSVDQFDQVDNCVIQVAQNEPQHFTELVYTLTEGLDDDLQKVRSIFRWITLKDLNKTMFEDQLESTSPYFFLKGIKYGLESYHELFRRLCSYAGIAVEIIHGMSKSAGYQPGMQPTSNNFRNIWSAAYIADCWRFVDCHWGARHVDKSRDPAHGMFCYSLDEFFFLTNPEDMIYMHFPDDPKWQLLDKQLSLDDFINLPVVKSTFFQYGLKFMPFTSAILQTDNGILDIIVRKQHLGEKISNYHNLVFNSRLESIEGEIFEGHSIFHNADAGIVFHVNLPFAGEYIFTVFACEKDKSDMYNNICSFKLISNAHDKAMPGRFPLLPDGYGPTFVAKEFRLETENQEGYYIVTQENKLILNVRFKTPVNISQKYFKGGYMGDKNDIELERHYFQRYRDHQHVSYLLKFPAAGFYVFSIFAAKVGKGSQILECACRYVLHCTSRSMDHVIKIYPRVQQHWIKCRLHEPTHGDLKVNKNVKFKIEVQNSTAVAVIVGQQWFYLKQAEAPEEKARNIWVGVAHTGKEPKHKLEVYARFRGNNADFFPLLEYGLVSDD